MTDAIGALRARVQLKEPMSDGDDMGGGAIVYIDRGSSWAEVAAIGAGEFDAYGVAVSMTRFSVTLRARSDVRAGWDVVWGVRRLRVTGMRDDGGPRLVLDCEELAP